MTTEKKAASNRRNAQKSTGPRSAAGKALVSRNALKHGLLSRHLIAEGESQEEFSDLLRLLLDEFQPVGLVEHALVERVGVAIWRQRRLVRAESAQVSMNQIRFGYDQRVEVGHVLDLDSDDYRGILAPDGHNEGADVNYFQKLKRRWQSLLDKGVAYAEDPFSFVPADLQKMLLQWLKLEADGIDAFVKEELGSWASLFEEQVERFDRLIRKERIPEVSRLVMQSQALPDQTDLLARYQTALDNDLYKALKALREAQAWRQARAVIDVAPAATGSEETGE